jgi:hypothetical protein
MKSEEEQREPEEPTELERFLKLARKFVRVPKHESAAAPCEQTVSTSSRS